MLPTTALLFLLPLISAGPTPPQQPQRRSAQLVPIPQRRSFTSGGRTKVFDVDAAQAERARVIHRHSTDNQQATSHKKRTGGQNQVQEAETGDPFDIGPARKQGKLIKRASSGEEQLQDQQDALYYGPLAVGTPPQQTTCDFDTGSADLLIPTQACTGCNGPLFTTTQSSTYKASSQPFQIQYGDGSQAAGTLSQDVVTVAGQTVQSQSFAAITQESSDFSGPFASLMGLGFPALAKSQQTPFFFNLVNQNLLTSKVFSFFMARGGNSGSELCLGCIDSTKYTGSLKYYSLDPSATQGQQAYWNILADGVSVNGQTVTQSVSCVLDTGSTGIYLPSTYAAAVYASISGAQSAPQLGQGYYTIPCNAKLPTIAFVFGGVQYAIDSSDFSLGTASRGGNLCVGGIIGTDMGTGTATLGDEFLKNWYTVYDASQNRVGLAQSNQAGSTAASGSSTYSSSSASTMRYPGLGPLFIGLFLTLLTFVSTF